MGPLKKPLKRPAVTSAPAPTSPVRTVDSADYQGAPEDMDDQDYLNKRARNNDAVKRSRAKAKAKISETHDRVTVLKQENEDLEGKIKLLSKELAFLKDIFLAHAGSSHAGSSSIKDLGIDALLNEGGFSGLSSGGSSTDQIQSGSGGDQS